MFFCGKDGTTYRDTGLVGSKGGVLERDYYKAMMIAKQDVFVGEMVLSKTSNQYVIPIARAAKDAEKREKYKLYGELINVYGYNLEEGAKELIAPNFYDDNKEIKIPLDPTKTARENSQKYFDRYGKLKRTAEALDTLLAETKAEIDHLESIQNSLDIALSADDLVQIKQELMEYGFIKKHRTG